MTTDPDGCLSAEFASCRERTGVPNYADLITPAADDSVLVAAAQQGDQKALDALLRRHVDRIFAICWRLARNDADAADAAQEAMIAISTKIDRFDGRASFSTWAYRVATNACLDELRRRGRRPDPGLPDDAILDAGTQHRSTNEDRVSAQLVIEAGLRELPEEFRVCVVLRDLCDLDYQEISETLGIPPGTVRSRIARGRAALAEQLGGNQASTSQRQTPEP